MNQNRRAFLFIDREVQGALLLRTACYWLFCLFSITLIVLCWNALTGPPRRFVDLATEFYLRYSPALAASLIMLPIVLFDVLRLSNRFVGPVVRLRIGLNELAEGRPAQPLNFRDDDFWRSLANEFNRAAARLAREGTELSRPTEEMSATEVERAASLSS